MSPDGPIKLVSELLDLPLIDSDGKYCLGAWVCGDERQTSYHRKITVRSL